MAEEGSNIFRALVEVVDKATAPLKGIASVVKTAAGIEHEAHKHGAEGAHEHAHAFEALTAHVKLLRGHMVSLTGSIGEIGRSFSEFLPMLAGVGAAGSLVGLFELTEHASEAFSELNKSAMEAGVTAQQFSELAMAAKLTDVPVATMSTGLFRLNRVIGDSAAGKNKDAAALFRHLGISMRDSNGHLRDAANLMPALADAFQHTTDPAMRARMAMVLFGRAGKDLLPLLDQGRDKMEEYAKAAREVDYVPKGEEAEQLEEFHKSWVTLTAAVSGFTTAIGAKLAPVLRPVVDLAKDWIVANRKWIAEDIAGAVGELAGWLRSLSLHEIVESTKEWIHTIRDVASELGGWHTAIGAVVLVLGAPMLGAVATVIESVEAFSGVLKSIGLLLWANPILAAVGLVAAAAYEIYEHWDWVKKQLTAVFEWFTHQDAAFQVLMTAILPFIGIPAEIYAHWGPIKEFFANLWNGVTGAFTAAWNKIKPIVDLIKGAVDAVSNSWVGRQLAGTPATAEHADQLRSVRTGHRLPSSPFEPGSASAAAAAGGAPGAAGAAGKVETVVTIKGLPPGSTVQTSASGNAVKPETNVGYADPLAYAF